MGAVLRADDPLAGRDRLKLAELAGRRWFQFPDGTDPIWRSYWNGGEPREGPVVRAVQECLQAVLWNGTVGMTPLGHDPPGELTVVPLTDMPADLSIAAATPNYNFITPNLCNDGHDTGCANGDPGDQKSINTFLQQWVPQILNSPAFREDGLLIITFDEAEPTDGSSCCNEPTGFNTPMPGITGRGGGRIGAVMISPFIKPGTVSDVPYNHYSQLKSIENMFGLPYLGYANQMDLVTFGKDIFNQ